MGKKSTKVTAKNEKAAAALTPEEQAEKDKLAQAGEEGTSEVKVPAKPEEGKKPGENPGTTVSKAKHVNVVDPNGTVIRTYSEEEHGNGYRKLAKQFAEKKGYKLA